MSLCRPIGILIVLYAIGCTKDEPAPSAQHDEPETTDSTSETDPPDVESQWLDLCRPCVSAAGCSLSDSECVDYGAAGKFCGTRCTNDTDCPRDYTCTDGQCRLSTGTCKCTDRAVKDAAKTPCVLTNKHGTCPGERVCTEAGLTDCVGQIPAAEICDGLDNGCNGETDEGLGHPSGPNTAGNLPAADKTFGVCSETTKVCVGEPGWVEPDYMAIKNYEPIEFTCDGLDNDCDGSIDENCSFNSYGNNLGDGSEANSDNGQFFVNTTIGTPRFVGTATNPTFVIHHRLPKGGNK